MGAHGLHHGGVRPDLDLSAFGIAGAERPHGAVAVAAAVAFHAVAGFGGMPFVIEQAASSLRVERRR